MHTTCKNVEILHDFKLKKNTQIFSIMTKKASAIPDDFHRVQIKLKLQSTRKDSFVSFQETLKLDRSSAVV